MKRGRSSSAAAVAGGGDQPREADELRVELLVERPRAALGGLDRAERARDVGAEGVVLRGVDLAARRQEMTSAAAMISAVPIAVPTV